MSVKVSVPGRPLFFFFSVFSHGSRVKGPVPGLFYKGTNLNHEGSILMTNYLPKIPPNIMTLDVRTSTYEFLSDANIQSVAGN